MGDTGSFATNLVGRLAKVHVSHLPDGVTVEIVAAWVDNYGRVRLALSVIGGKPAIFDGPGRKSVTFGYCELAELKDIGERP